MARMEGWWSGDPLEADDSASAPATQAATWWEDDPVEAPPAKAALRSPMPAFDEMGQPTVPEPPAQVGAIPEPAPFVPQEPPRGEFRKGLDAGVAGAKQMAAAAATIPFVGIDRQSRETLAAFDEIDRGSDAPLRQRRVPTGMADPIGQQARMYYDSPAEERASIRKSVVDTIASNKDFRAGIVDAWKRYGAEAQASQGKTVDFTDIRDLEGFKNWFAYNTGQGIPYLAGSALSGIIGGALGGPAGAAVGVGAAGFGMGVGDIQSELMDKGISDRPDVAIAGAIPYAALDFLGPVGRTLRNLSRPAVEQVARNYFQRLGREIPANLVEEFINEAGQEIVKDAAVTSQTGEKLLTDESLLRWFNSGMAGTASAGPGSVVSAIPGGRQAPQPIPQQEIPPSVSRETVVSAVPQSGSAVPASAGQTENAATGEPGEPLRTPSRVTPPAPQGPTPTPEDLQAVLDDPRPVAEIMAERERQATIDAVAAEDGPEVAGAIAKVIDGQGTRTAPLRVETAQDIDAAAAALAVQPTPRQGEAGNYQKIHLKMPNGLDIAIEVPRGGERAGVGPDGRPWSVTMPAHYGYLKAGKDSGDGKVDVFVGDFPEARYAYVIDQIDPATGKFDEPKVMMGMNGEGTAAATYEMSYSDGSGPARMGAITRMTVAELKAWLRDGNPKKPLAYVPKAPKVPEAPAAADAWDSDPIVQPAPAALPNNPLPFSETRPASTVPLGGQTAAPSSAGFPSPGPMPTTVAPQDPIARARAFAAERNIRLSGAEMVDVRELVAEGVDPEEAVEIALTRSGLAMADEIVAATEEAPNEVPTQTEAEPARDPGEVPAQEGRREEPADARAETGRAPQGEQPRGVEPGQAEGRGTDVAVRAETAPSEPLVLRIGDRTYPVQSIEDASRIFVAARDKFGEGASNTPTPIIERDGRAVGYISYNGRVWAGSPQDRSGGKTPIYDPLPPPGKPAEAMTAALPKPEAASPRPKTARERREEKLRQKRDAEITRREAAKKAIQTRKANAGALNIVQTIAAAGGLKDVGGDLRTIMGRPNLMVPVYGALRNEKTGMEPDRAREMLVEAGFLPEGATLNDLYAAIDQTVRGNPVMSARDVNEQLDRKEERKAQKHGDKPKPEDDDGALKDAGEKIGGARKDLWRERGLTLADLDQMSGDEAARATTKQNVWTPDYAKMVEDGAAPKAVALVKVIFDAMAAKPKADTPAGRAAFIEMVSLVRDAASEVKTIDDARQVQEKVLSRIGWKEKGGWQDQEIRTKFSSIFKGRSSPLGIDYSDMAKAQKLVDGGFPVAAEPWTRRFNVRQARDDVWRVYGAGENKYRIQHEAKTKDDAEAWARAEYGRTKGARADGELPDRPHLDKIRRSGKDVRAGRDIASQDLVDEFGVRGVEFGNWAASDERQKALNLAYEALHDLAAVMGVPPKAISLNGTLGLAFGARGGGAHAAHYEPGKLAINLTKLRGAGTLAHEWGHALDHYMGELDTATAYQGRARYTSGGSGPRPSRVGPNLRPELAAAFSDLMSTLFQRNKTRAELVRDTELTIENLSAEAASMAERVEKAKARGMEGLADFAKRSAEFIADRERGVEVFKRRLQVLTSAPDADLPKLTTNTSFLSSAIKLSGKSGSEGYWARPTELLARSFEAFVFDKIEQSGNASEYLVQGVEADRYAGSAYRGNPYPTEAERERINASWQNVVDTLKLREGKFGPNSALYQMPRTERIAVAKDSISDEQMVIPGAERVAAEGRKAAKSPQRSVAETPLFGGEQDATRDAKRADADRDAKKRGSLFQMTSGNRRHGVPATAIAAHQFKNDQPLKASESYRAAKAGDAAAAVRLIDELAPDVLIEKARGLWAGAIFAPAVAQEATGANAIPSALAARLAVEADGDVSRTITQASRAHHTGAAAMERIASRPLFSGEVVKGGRYVLVDDVTTMGGTLAEMANHVIANGGEVIGVATLVSASRNGVFSANQRFISEIERRFGDVVRQKFGVEPTALTADEAQYLVGFRDADELRSRIASARRERADRLRARGLQGQAPQGAVDQTRASAPVSRSDTPDRARLRVAGEIDATVNLTPKDAAQRDAVANAVRVTLRRMVGKAAPDASVFDSMMVGEQEVTGAYSPASNLIAVSLRSPDPIGTVRHETIHVLRQLGLIDDAAWSALTQAAETGGWLDKHAIDERWGEGLTREQALEEAIAEEFGVGLREGVWKTGNAKADAIFQRIAEFFRRVRAEVKRALAATGLRELSDADVAELVFSLIERGAFREGEITARETREVVAQETDGDKTAYQMAAAGAQQAANAPQPRKMRTLRAAISALRGGDAVDPLAKVRVPNDIGWARKTTVTPRTIAAYFPAFADAFFAGTRQFQARDMSISELTEIARPYLDLEQASKDKVAKVIEHGRMAGEVYTPEDDGTIKVENKVGQQVRGKIGGVTLMADGETVTLDAKEVGAYRAYRKVMDRALNKFRDQVVREWGFDPGAADAPKTAEDVDDLARNTENAGERARLKTLSTVLSSIETAKRRGYVPFTRYGSHYVTVTSMQDGKSVVVHREHIEPGLTSDPKAFGPLKRLTIPRLEQQAAALRARLAEIYPPSRGFQISELREVTPASFDDIPDFSDLDAIIAAANLPPDQSAAVQQALGEVIQKRGFRAHFIKSRNIPGYSVDFERSLADYIVGISGYLARREHLPEIEAAIAAIPATQPELRRYAKEWSDYIQNPSEEWNGLRQAGFLWYLSGRLSSAVVNLSQVPMVTAPYLSMFASPVQASAEIARAYKDAGLAIRPKPKSMGGAGLDFFDPDALPADVREAVKTAIANGTLLPIETFQEMARAQGKTPKSRSMAAKSKAAQDAAAFMFQAAERTNRLVSFIAAYRLAQRPEVMGRIRSDLSRNPLWTRRSKDRRQDAATFAAFVVEETQFLLGKINRTKMMRGPGSVIFQFKAFAANYLELMARLGAFGSGVHRGGRNYGALAGMAFALFMVGGLFGLPGAEDGLEMIEALIQSMTGVDPQIERGLRESAGSIAAWAARQLSAGEETQDTVSRFAGRSVARGVARESGVDVSQRIGQGRFVPQPTGTEHDSFWYRAVGLAGIPGSWLLRGLDVGSALSRGDFLQAGIRFVPEAVADPLRAAQRATEGVKTIAKGRQVMRPDETLPDGTTVGGASNVTKLALGFRPAGEARAREQMNAVRRAGEAPRDLFSDFNLRRANIQAAINRATGVVDAAKTPEARKIAEAAVAREAARMKRVMGEIEAYNESAPFERQYKLLNPGYAQQLKTANQGQRETQIKKVPMRVRGSAEDIRARF